MNKKIPDAKYVAKVVFIEKAIDDYKKELIEKLEGKKKSTELDITLGADAEMTRWKNIVENQLIDDIINLIK